MRRVIIAISAALICGLTTMDAVAQNWKVVESSTRKAPQWVDGMDKDFIVVSQIAGSIEEAKELLLQNIQRQIIGSVATNVRSSFENNTKQTTTNDGVNDFSESVASKFATQAAKLPFINSISMNKVEDYYWEKEMDKKSKQVRYIYSVRYPFSSVELKKLVIEFQEQDAKMELIFDSLQTKLKSYSSVEELDNAIASLQQLEDYFFDEIRINKSKALKNSYHKEYQNIKPVIELIGSSKAMATLRVGERPITSNQKPVVKSNCAIGMSAIHRDGKTMIEYDNSGCVTTDQNYLEVIYRLGNKSVGEKIYFDIDAGRTLLSFDGKPHIEFTITPGESGLTTAGLVVSLKLQSQNAVPFSVREFNFTIPEVKNPISMGGLDLQFAQKGVLDLKISTDRLIDLQTNTKSKLSMIKGSLLIVNNITGEQIMLRLTSNYTSNM